MASLKLSLLGGFDCRTAADATVVLPTRKARALFAYLAMNRGEAQPREKLAAFFWEEKSNAQGRANLRKTLSRLKQALPAGTEDCLAADAKQVRLRADTVEVDALSFDKLADSGAPEDLAQAASLFRGEFLEMFPDCGEAFERWLMTERRRLDESARSVLGRLLEHYVVTGAVDRAIRIALRLLALDSLQEGVHRTLIRLYLYQDRTGSALQQYMTCRDVLARELGVEPAAETEALHARLMPAAAQGEITASDSGLPETLDLPARFSIASPGERDRGCGRFGLPGRPSIAVLPFTELGDGGSCSYLGDSMAEDIVTVLGRFREIDVIAPATAIACRDSAESVEAAGGELGTRYVLEGSLRPQHDGLRITARLIESETGRQLWAERFDRELADPLALQDEITSAIVANVDAGVKSNEQDRARRKPSDGLDAWDLYQRGMWHLYRFKREDSDCARRLFRDSIRRSPEFSLPYAALALNGYAEVTYGDSGATADILEESIHWGENAVYLDEGGAFGHFALGRVYTLFGNLDVAIPHLQKAIALNPSFGYAHYGLGFALYWIGKAAETIPHVDTAIRLGPRDPMLWSFYMVKAFSHYQLDRYDVAERCARNAILARAREFWPHLALAVAQVRQGRPGEARAAIDEARRVKPGLSLALIVKSLPGMHAGYMQRYLEDLNAAGLPD